MLLGFTNAKISNHKLLFRNNFFFFELEVTAPPPLSFLGDWTELQPQS